MYKEWNLDWISIQWWVPVSEGLADDRENRKFYRRPALLYHRLMQILQTRISGPYGPFNPSPCGEHKAPLPPLGHQSLPFGHQGLPFGHQGLPFSHQGLHFGHQCLHFSHQDLSFGHWGFPFGHQGYCDMKRIFLIGSSVFLMMLVRYSYAVNMEK